MRDWLWRVALHPDISASPQEIAGWSFRLWLEAIAVTDARDAMMQARRMEGRHGNGD